MGRRQKGAVTVEAAIALPVFICVVVSIIFFIKVVYVYNMMQFALDESAGQLSTYAYLVHALRVKEKTEKAFTNNEPEMESKVLSLTEIISGFNGDKASTDTGFKESILRLVGTDGKNVYEILKREAAIPIVRRAIENNIETSLYSADTRLKALSVKNGMGGLDFSHSSFFENNGNDIDIIVIYTIKLPLPIKIFSEFKIVQRSFKSAWLGGDGEGSLKADIWSLNNLSRGRKVHEIFGANLPFQFPGISSFRSGTATLIRSLDFTSKTYKNTDNLKSKLYEYIDSLASYKGQSSPWGKERIVINKDEIINRELLLIIPENEWGPESEAAFNDCLNYAFQKKVVIRIIKYGNIK